MKQTRDKLLNMTDEELLDCCRLDCFRASGPGGQHRNKTESAVRLILKEYEGIAATATERRSQHQNRREALQNLRMEIAFTLRETEITPFASAKLPRCNPGNPDYTRLIARILDALCISDYDLGHAVELLHTSAAQVRKLFQRDSRLLHHVNQKRQDVGLTPLKT